MTNPELAHRVTERAARSAVSARPPYLNGRLNPERNQPMQFSAVSLKQRRDSDDCLGEEKLVRFLDPFAEKLDRVELDIRRRQARFGSSSANLYNS
jgi:hypothetical protein